MSKSGTAGHGGGGGAGKASFHDFTFTHPVDKASPLLMKARATGEHIKDATITLRKLGKGQQEYLVIKMTDVLVTSVSTSVSAEGDAPIEGVVLGVREGPSRVQAAEAGWHAGPRNPLQIRPQSEQGGLVRASPS
jgi:type VI protein secretion system component Hcp